MIGHIFGNGISTREDYVLPLDIGVTSRFLADLWPVDELASATAGRMSRCHPPRQGDAHFPPCRARLPLEILKHAPGHVS